MITYNTKKIFNNAAKENEKFVREAISVFPKIEITKKKIVSNKKLKNTLQYNNKGKIY